MVAAAALFDTNMVRYYNATMPGLNVRDLSVDVLRALKRRARAHHRSVQGEVHAILEEAARSAPPEGGYGPIVLRFVDLGGDSAWTREEMYDDNGR